MCVSKLFDIALTPRIAGTEELYYRKRNTGISFDTYFNGIPVRKLRKYTTIRELRFSKKVEICTEQNSLKTCEAIRLEEIPEDAELLYLKTDTMPVHLTVNAIGTTSKVYLAIIICTYHRFRQVRSLVMDAGSNL